MLTEWTPKIHEPNAAAGSPNGALAFFGGGHALGEGSRQPPALGLPNIIHHTRPITTNPQDSQPNIPLGWSRLPQDSTSQLETFCTFTNPKETKMRMTPLPGTISSRFAFRNPPDDTSAFAKLFTATNRPKPNKIPKTPILIFSPEKKKKKKKKRGRKTNQNLGLPLSVLFALLCPLSPL